MIGSGGSLRHVRLGDIEAAHKNRITAMGRTTSSLNSEIMARLRPWIGCRHDAILMVNVLLSRRDARQETTKRLTAAAWKFPGNFAIRGGNRSRLLTIRHMVRSRRYLPINLPRPLIPRGRVLSFTWPSDLAAGRLPCSADLPGCRAQTCAARSRCP
jgi:hypothetical protein